jgi:hypothetical protein
MTSIEMIEQNLTVPLGWEVEFYESDDKITSTVRVADDFVLRCVGTNDDSCTPFYSLTIVRE